MKIRSGFVSNSSSSSFVALVPTPDWHYLLMNFTPIEQAVLESAVGSATFCGISCVDFAYVSGNQDSFEYADWDKIIARAKEIAAGKNIVFDEEAVDKQGACDSAYRMMKLIRGLGERAYTNDQDF